MANQTNQTNTAVATRQTGTNLPAVVKNMLGTQISSNAQLASLFSTIGDNAIIVFPRSMGKPIPGANLTVVHVPIETAGLDPKKNFDGNKDVYKSSDGSYVLHFSKLNEIAQNLGIIIKQDPNNKPEIGYDDKTGEPIEITYYVVWEYKTVDGSLRQGDAKGFYSLKNDQASRGDSVVKQRRSKPMQLAETNAWWRAICKAIPELKTSYTLEDLKSKPFLVPRLSIDTDAQLDMLTQEDAYEIRRALIAKNLGVAEQIYGSPKPQQRMQLTPAPINQPQEPTVIQQPKEAQPEQQQHPEPIPDAEVVTDSSVMDEDEAEAQAESWRDGDEEFRANHILQLLDEKDFTPRNPVTFEKLLNWDFDKVIKPLLKKLYMAANK